MKIFLILLMGMSLMADDLSKQDFLQQKDKQEHIAGTMAISGVATALARHYGSNKFEAFAIGVATGLLVGVAKERWDGAGHGVEDIQDVYADTIGAVVGSAISAQFSWRF